MLLCDEDTSWLTQLTVAAQVLQEGDLVCEGRVSELPSSAPTAQVAADANSQRSSALDGLKAGTLLNEPFIDDCTLQIIYV